MPVKPAGSLPWSVSCDVSIGARIVLCSVGFVTCFFQSITYTSARSFLWVVQLSTQLLVVCWCSSVCYFWFIYVGLYISTSGLVVSVLGVCYLWLSAGRFLLCIYWLFRCLGSWLSSV